MNAAAWAGSIAAMIMCAGSIGVLLLRVGRREGKVDQVLEQLVQWQRDHDERHRDELSARDGVRLAPRRGGARG